MTFTDKDLRRLKEDLHEPVFTMEKDKILDLLARLAAAELVAHFGASKHKATCLNENCPVSADIEAWHQAMGK